MMEIVIHNRCNVLVFVFVVAVDLSYVIVILLDHIIICITHGWFLFLIFRLMIKCDSDKDYTIDLNLYSN